MGDSVTRRNKIIRVFKFFDKDDSNFIDEKDFQINAQIASKFRGWQPGDAEYKHIEDSLLNVWESMRKHADKNNDGKVSLDEWILMWDMFAKNPSAPLEWQSLHCKVNFDFYDANGDGVIDVDEYIAVFRSCNVDKEKAVGSFHKLAKGKSSISWEDYQELWQEFFVSNDQHAPGNHMFDIMNS